MLETEYNMPVSRMVLGVVHPVRARGQLIEVPRLHGELNLLVGTLVAEGRATHTPNLLTCVLPSTNN